MSDTKIEDTKVLEEETKNKTESVEVDDLTKEEDTQSDEKISSQDKQTVISEVDPLVEQEIRHLESYQPKHFLKNRSLVIAVSFLAILVLSCIAVVSYVVLLPEGFPKAEDIKLSETINLENTDPSLVEELKESLVYGTTQDNPETGEVKYYSPLIDTLVVYPIEKYTVRDDGRGIIFQLKDTKNKDYSNFARMFIVEKKDLNDNINKYFEQYYSYQEDLEIISSSIDKISKLHIEYSQHDYANDSKIKKQRVIYSRQENDNYLVVELIFDKSINLEDYEESLVNILSKAQVKPGQLEQEIQVVLENTGLGIKFDRQKWVKDYISVYSASFVFRSDVYEQKGLKYSPQTYFNLYTERSYKEIDEDYIQKYIQTNLVEVNKVLYKDKNYQEQALFTEKHSGIDFTIYQYSFDGYNNKEDIVRVYNYIGKMSNNMLLKISIRTVGEATKGLEEAKVLLDNLSFPSSESQTEASASNGMVLGVTSAQIDTAAIVGKPSVVHIFNRTCVEMNFNKTTSLPNFKGKKYTVCSAGFGSGAFISKEGYIITNSHVATPNSFDVIVSSMGNGVEDSQLFWSNLKKEVIALLKKDGENVSLISDTEISGIMWTFLYALKKDGQVSLTPSYSNYIEIGTPFKGDSITYELLNKSLYGATTLVDTRGNDSGMEITIQNAYGESAGIKTPDLALLKVENSSKLQYPVLELADPDTISLGTQISAIGFPGSANNKQLYSSEAASIPTITKGNISSVKPSFNNEFNLIEIDASISHGNSGGPIVNASGEIVGISTYGANFGNNEGADFNAGVSVEEVLSLVKDNNIVLESGDYNLYLKKGLQAFNNSYFEIAKENLQKASDLYEPSSDVLRPLIKISQSKIDAGESLIPKSEENWTDILQTNKWLIIGGSGAFILVLIILIVLIVMVSRRHKIRKEKERVLKLQQLYSQRQAPPNQQYYQRQPNYAPYQGGGQQMPPR